MVKISKMKIINPTNNFILRTTQSLIFHYE